MYDGSALGHRRNMLDPSVFTMGSGSVPATPGFASSEAQLVLTTPLPVRPAVRTGFVAWPPQGFVPYQVVYPRWSFSLPNANFANATVSMTHNGVALGVSVRCIDPNVSGDPNCGQYAEPAISWTPSTIVDGASWPQPSSDDPYTVTVSNVAVNGVFQAPFTYTVTVIDPGASDASHTAASAPTGPTNPGVSTNPTYSIPPIIDATGYQWRTSSQSPGDLIDGAEAGLANFTANVTPVYNPISTVEHASGGSSFRLVGFGDNGSPATQTLTLNRSLVVRANSSLSFDSLYWSNLNLAAQVQVSLDAGTTWAPTFSENPPFSQQDSSFTAKTVPLGQFAGRQIQLRFALTFTGGNWAIGCCGEPDGWYIDNLNLANVAAVSAPIVSAVGANPTFTFANSQQGAVSIDVRPQFTNPSFGAAFGDWSPSLLVTSLGNTGITTVTSSANPSAQGQQVTYTATVVPTDGGGSISFSNNLNAIPGCQNLPLSAGQATCSQTYSISQPTSITATYSGDTSFAGSTSPALVQTINAPAYTSGSLSSSAGSLNGGQQVTLTATISPSDGGGTVAFTTGSASVIPGCGAVPLTGIGQAICIWSPPAGHLNASAYFSGDTAFAATNLGSVLLAVTQQTATSVASSANPSSAGQLVLYTAAVTPTISSGTVLFRDNGSVIPGCGMTPLDSGGQAICATTYDSNGPHSIQAVYSGFAMGATAAASSSPFLSQSVGTLAATSTTINSSVNPAVTGQSITFTAAVSPAAVGGSVSFTDAGNPVPGCSSLALSGTGQTTCNQTYSDTSPHSLAAVYSGDSSNAGSSSPTVNQTIALATPPAVPTAIANLGNAAARVLIAPPATLSRGYAVSATVSGNVTGYNVYQGTSPGNESSTPINASRLLATAGGYTVTGLTIGTTYYFTVRAINAGGVGPASPEVSARSANTPTSPTATTATASKGTIVVRWSAPTSSGGSPITGYNVFRGTAATGESLNPLTATPLSASARSFIATGLDNGTRYFFVVRAKIAVASSPPSAESSAVATNVPDAPTTLTAYPGNGVIRIRWAAPELSGGSPITGYNVYKGTITGDQSTTPVNGTPLSRTSSTFTVSGLTNGTKYYINVRAINAVGKSLASKQASATPTSAPTAPPWPQNLAATAGSGSVSLTWTAPSSTGGSKITGYNVYRGTLSGAESTIPVNSAPLPATAISYNATGLANARAYYFTVKAINAIGTGGPSNEATATPYAASTVPGAPATLTATAGVAKATLTWTAPSWNGGSPITGYNVYQGTSAGGESATPLNATPLSASTKMFTVTGLTSGRQYFFTVRAANAVGSSGPIEASARPT